MKEKITLKKTVQHLLTISKHKAYVAEECFRVGLYRQGLAHDLSKYSPSEFFVGARYYQGDRSPNNAEREDKGYSSAWLHHKGRNKHHLEYWIDYDLKNKKGGVTGMKMPDNYIVEMFCDRVAASKIYHKDDYSDDTALQYYLHGKSKVMLHPYVKKKLEMLLYMLADKGEDYTFAYCRRYMKAYKRYIKVSKKRKAAVNKLQSLNKHRKY